MENDSRCPPTPVRTKVCIKAPLRIVGFDTSPTSVICTPRREEGAATPHPPESVLGLALSRERQGFPRLTIACPSKFDTSAMKKSKSTADLYRHIHHFEARTPRHAAASASGSPPGSQPSSCCSNPIRIPSSPSELRRRHSTRSFTCASVTEETLPASGHGYVSAGSWAEPAGACPPTCAAADPHFLPPDAQVKQPKVSTLVLPLIEEGDPVLRDCGFLAKFDMDDEPSLASGSTRWALPQFA
ncbi:hypothetical protein ACKKBG_A17730 [Auxenochlorella protothecoides x Auxenochlorella symbiontica]|uniref:Uncharacterized protein n=1 Tax=Auxenochlorella protothecoides TaxID=3075 RepID=A0A1D2A0N4_AUXPR